MKIIPSIDLYNGYCVRLKHGQTAEMTTYPISAVDYAKVCIENNLRYLHIVNLDAVFGFYHQSTVNVIKELVEIPGLKVQVGGGINTVDIAKNYIDIGVDRICLSSVLFNNPDVADEIIKTVGADKVVIAADFKDGYVVKNGWKDRTYIKVSDFIKNVHKEAGINKFICTDVSKDGMLSGYSEKAYKELLAELSDIDVEIIGSGGCSSISDVINVSQYLDSCIIGKALFENRIPMYDLKEISFEDCVDWEKCNGLVPCIVQDYKTKDVLMLAYMNKEALHKTVYTKVATFYSRSSQEIWVKGKSHGTCFYVADYKLDCDNDTILLYVDTDPNYNVCHLGWETCFGKRDFSLYYLDNYIHNIKCGNIPSKYTKSLLDNNISRIAQKVGEEAVETVIAAVNSDTSDLIYESADLLYHLEVLLNKRDISINDVILELKQRHIDKREDNHYDEFDD